MRLIAKAKNSPQIDPAAASSRLSESSSRTYASAWPERPPDGEFAAPERWSASIKVGQGWRSNEQDEAGDSRTPTERSRNPGATRKIPCSRKRAEFCIRDTSSLSRRHKRRNRFLQKWAGVTARFGRLRGQYPIQVFKRPIVASHRRDGRETVVARAEDGLDTMGTQRHKCLQIEMPLKQEG